MPCSGNAGEFEAYGHISYLEIWDIAYQKLLSSVAAISAADSIMINCAAYKHSLPAPQQCASTNSTADSMASFHSFIQPAEKGKG